LKKTCSMVMDWTGSTTFLATLDLQGGYHQSLMSNFLQRQKRNKNFNNKRCSFPATMGMPTFDRSHPSYQMHQRLILQRTMFAKTTEVNVMVRNPTSHTHLLILSVQFVTVQMLPTITFQHHVSTSGPGGSRIIQYYSCKKFAELSPANRLSLLKSKGLCFQCLFPAADASSGRHKEGKCQHDFTCQHESHQRYPVHSQANKDLLERFKQRFITRSTSLPSFARNISLSFHSTFSYVSQTTINGDGDSINDKGLFLLQTVNINRNNFTIFYDNGCSDFIVKQSAITLLGKNATKISNVPIQIGGVGDTTTESTLGTFNVKLPMFNGQHASLTGTCLKSITTEFPRYPLSEVMDDIQRSFASNINNAIQLPQPSSSIGGEVHLMIGVKYLRYHPRLVHQLTSGLGIYESVFQNADGGRGIIGGPHPIFTRIHQSFFNQSEALGFFTNQYKLFQMGVQINPDVKMLSFPSKQKRFEASEMTGSEISYRCIQCRSCKTCKDSDHQQDISIKEEVEQEIINASLKIELQSNTITAILPFIHNPTVKLAPNK